MIRFVRNDFIVLKRDWKWRGGRFLRVKTKQVVRRGHYEKKDVVDALERMHRGEYYAEVARTPSVSLRTLFKKAKD